MQDWNQKKTITIFGVDDFIPDGDQDYSLLISVSSDDPKYNSSDKHNALEALEIILTNFDDGEDFGIDIYGDLNGIVLNDISWNRR